jgi:hypothetical protein
MDPFDEHELQAVFEQLPNCGYSTKACNAIVDWYHR